MKVALYARVSTNGKGQDTELQLRDLRAYAEHRQMEVYREYVDQGVSGRKDSRPQLDLLMNDARRGYFNAVMVWRFDRFARSTRHLVTALEDFRTMNIDFISHQECIDTSTSTGKVMFTVIAAMAEFESDLIRERVIAGIAHARAQGKHLGRPGVPVDAQRVADLRNNGLSVRQIARELGLSKSTVHKSFTKCA